jgi:hypothetical protein
MEGMELDVEINLKIPRLKTPARDDRGYPIDTYAIRFTKTITVSMVPKEGTVLPLSTQSGQTFEAAVIRSDWHESREMFVVYCKFARRSIPQEIYDDLMRGEDWTAKPLL